MIKKLMRRVYRWLQKPPVRYSPYFSAMAEVFRYSPREEMLKLAMEYVASNKLDGDYLEFGVYRGGSFTQAFYFAKKNNLKKMKFYAFDSFQGLPKIAGVDLQERGAFEKGKLSCSVDEFKKIISKNGVDLNRVVIVPGWFDKVLNDETKKKLSLKSAVVIMIDCDLYESTVPVLNFMTDYLADGSLLIFDDWFFFKGDPNRGEQKAFNEWLKKNPSIKATQFYRYGWQGNSFIIHRG